MQRTKSHTKEKVIKFQVGFTIHCNFQDYKKKKHSNVKLWEKEHLPQVIIQEYRRLQDRNGSVRSSTGLIPSKSTIIDKNYLKII